MAKINSVSNIEQGNYNKSNQKVSSQKTDFESYLGESKSLDQIFDKAAKKYGVPVNLLKAIGKQESNFNPKALSRCGAQGIMQLMPSTAKGLGVTDAFDAEQNIMAGAKYIAAKIDKYDGDVKLALAAYNAGSGNVAKYGGIPPFKETQNYVKKVMGYYNDSDVTISDKYNYSAKSSGSNEAVNSQPLHVASVTIPTTIATNNSYLFGSDVSNIVDSAQDLNTIFSYDDYMKFLDILLNYDNDEKEAKEQNTNTSNYSDITYNPTVLNLLTNQNNQ